MKIQIARATALLALLVGSAFLIGCSKAEEPELPVNAKVTADGKPAPAGSENAPAAPGMDEGKGGRGKGKGGP